MRSALVVTALLLAMLITAEWFLLTGEKDLTGAIPLPRETTQPEEASTTSEFRLPALKVYREIEQRPLFSKQRRVETPPTQPREAPSLYPTQLVLRAILITSETHNAILYDRERNETLNVHLHEQIQGWTVTEIEKNHVTFTKGGYRIPLSLRQPSPSLKRDSSSESNNGLGEAHRPLE